MKRASSKKTKDGGLNPPQSTKYKVIHRIDDSLVFAEVDVKDLREQDLNARYMPNEMFAQFTKNIKKRGALEATPYCCLTDKGIEIISGHNTIRSFIASKVGKTVFILLETKPMSRSEITAKQLAHNSIAGIDDPRILKKMYLSIEQADLRLEAFIDENKLELPEPANVQITSLSTGLDMRNVKLLFLPYQLEDFEAIIQQLEGTEDKVYVAPIKEWPAFREAVNRTMQQEDIRSLGAAVARMSEIILEHYQNKKEKPT